MSSVQKHAKALQISATFAFVTAALTALPLLAADEFDATYYAHQIVQNFQRVGANTVGAYSNGSLESSAFDFQKFFSDTCYRATDFDIPGCKRRFGQYWNLKETYKSGQLASILRSVSYLQGAANLIPGSPAVPVQNSATAFPVKITPPTSAVSDTVDQYQKMLLQNQERGRHVWRICSTTYSNRVEQSRCYQSNIRLINTHTQPIDADMVINASK